MSEIIDLDTLRELQPTQNIGMIGSVSNGKSSITFNLTDVKTQRHSHEQIKNITIKLGYANAKIYECPTCPRPQCYQPCSGSKMSLKCSICSSDMRLRKHISIIDCPGHNMLMATMLNGTCVMSTSILVESAINQEMPSAQTIEHIIATKIMNLPISVICMNKLDLVTKEVAKEKIDKLIKYLPNTPIVPIAANYSLNIDMLCDYICNSIEEPIHDLTSNPKMIVIRSFNINKQGSKVADIQGGVVGGTVMKGVLRVNDLVEILPGFISKKDSKWVYQPIISNIHSINSEKTDLKLAIPGGLIGVQLSVDPSFTTNDGLAGSIITKIESEDKLDTTYKVYESIFVIFTMVDRYDGKKVVLKRKTNIVINHNACNIKSEIVRVKDNRMEIKLIDKPICAELGDYITISNADDSSNYILVARAQIKDGMECCMMDN